MSKKVGVSNKLLRVGKPMKVHSQSATVEGCASCIRGQRRFWVSHKFKVLVLFNALMSVSLISKLRSTICAFVKQERQVCKGKPSPLETGKRSIN